LLGFIDAKALIKNSIILCHMKVIRKMNKSLQIDALSSLQQENCR